MSDESKNAPHVTIDPKVIDEALQSVQRREEPSEPEASATNTVVPDDAAEQIRTLREDLLKARQELRQREAELETSQAMGRESTARVKETHERLLRTAADLENFRKRTQKEKEDLQRFGNEKLLKEILPVLDNLDRALDHAKSPTDFEGLRTGLQMTRKLFEETLARFGVKGFSSLNQPFDPYLHEAMQTVESDLPPNTVVAEMVRGYHLHERLIRPAMVVVARARPAQSEPVAPEAATEPAAEAGGEAPASEQTSGGSSEAVAETAPADAPAPSEPLKAADSTDARGAEDVMADESSN